MKSASSDLAFPSVGAAIRQKETDIERDERLAKMTRAVETLIECIGEDPSRQGLLATPLRYLESEPILFSI